MMKAAEAFADTPGKLPMVKATPKKVQSQSSESKPLLALPAPPAQEPSAAPLETAPGTDKDDNESSGQQKEEAEEDLDFTDDEEIDPDPETYADLSDTEPDAEQKNTSENDQQPVVDEGNHKESDVDVIKENQNPDQSQAGDVISPINPKGTAGDMVDVDMDKENKEDKEKEDDKVDHEKKSEKDDGIDNGNHETKSVMQDHAEVSPDVKDGLNTQDCADSNGEDLESLLDRAMEEQPSQHVGQPPASQQHRCPSRLRLNRLLGHSSRQIRRFNSHRKPVWQKHRFQEMHCTHVGQEARQTRQMRPRMASLQLRRTISKNLAVASVRSMTVMGRLRQRQQQRQQQLRQKLQQRLRQRPRPKLWQLKQRPKDVDVDVAAADVDEDMPVWTHDWFGFYVSIEH